MNAEALRERLLTLANGDGATPSISYLRDRIWRRVRPHLTVLPGDRAAGTPGAISDRELAQRLARGDAAAFEALIELYAGKLLGFAQRSLSLSDAEDAVQETFAVVVQKAEELAEHPNLGGFLFRTLRYLTVDALRRRERERGSPADVEAQGVDDQADAVAAAIIWQQDLERLAQALHDVCNPLEQEIIAMTRDDLEPSDIAQRLDLPANRVRVIKHRAIQKLRAALGVHHEGR